MITFSPEYQGLPANWTPPSCIKGLKDLFVIKETIKKSQETAKNNIYIPESNTNQKLSNRAKIFASFIGGVFTFTLSQMINSGLSVGNVALTALGMFVGYKFVAPGLYAKGAKITKNDLDSFIIEALKNPLFSVIYNKVNNPIPVQLIVEPGLISPGGHSFSFYGYLFQENKLVDHKIVIFDTIEPIAAFEALIYEFVNGYQRTEIEALHSAVHRGEVGKEEYAIAMEWIELNTLRLTEKILSYGKQYLNWQVEDPKMMAHLREEAIKTGTSLLAVKWHIENARISGSSSHADNYRQQWESMTKQDKSNPTVAIN